jgi:hypothetical protein
VIAYLQGARLSEISVRQGCGEGGSVFAYFDDGDWRSLVLFMMAGYWAQHYFVRDPRAWSDSSLDQWEWERILKAWEAPPGTEEALFLLCEKLVLRNRRLILKVAHKLQSGAGVEAIKTYLQHAAPRKEEPDDSLVSNGCG